MIFDPFALATQGMGPAFSARQWAMFGWAVGGGAVWGRGTVEAELDTLGSVSTEEVGDRGQCGGCR